MAAYLNNDGWETILLSKGEDDGVVLAEASLGGSVVVTGDTQALERCRRKGVETIDVGFQGRLELVKKYLFEKVGVTKHSYRAS